MKAAVASPLPETVSAAIRELLRGQDSAKKLRDLLITGVDHLNQPLEQGLLEGGGGGGGAEPPRSRPPVTAEDLVGDVFQSFTSVLSILNRGDSDEVSPQVPPVFGRCNPVESEESRESSQTHHQSSAKKDRRGCYKRRRSSVSWTKLSPSLTDDGYQWRKYGQKSILDTSFPRSYFRCTHKVDQGCQATKQVQQMSDDPSMFRSIYHGQHTCQNHLKGPQIILADSSPRDSSTLLSFKTKESPDDTNVHIDNDKNNPFSSSSFRLSAVKCENNEVTATNYVCASNNQSSSSQYEGFLSPDLTIFNSTIGSDQGEALSSSRGFDHHDVERMMDDVDFDVFDCHFSG